MTRRIRTIDAHAEGGPLRLIVEGWPTLAGRSMRRRFASATRSADALRRALFGEPRGHRDLIGAVLTEAASPGACAGLLFMNSERWLSFSGYGSMAAAAIAVERGLLTSAADLEHLTFDTLAGPASLKVALDAGPRRRVSCQAQPSCLLAPGMGLDLGGHRVLADVVWAGGVRLVVDSEAARVPLRRDRLDDIRRAGLSLVERFDARSHLAGVRVPHRRASGVVITGPPESEHAALRLVSIAADGTVDRSPSMCGSVAALTVLDRMGLAGDDSTGIGCESLAGTQFTAAIDSRVTALGQPAIVARVSGRVWITGEHVFLLSDDDPLAG
jgi:proline racemase